MRRIPDYLVYDEMVRRSRDRHDEHRVQIPLELPLYRPQIDELDIEQRRERDEDEPKRGVIIIDMNTGDVLED